MSAKIRYISDPHFGHKNMAIKRGFQDEFHHDEHIIEQWNKVVFKKDTTYIAGDITMEKNNYEILNRLNGYKRIVLGNHDMGNHIKHMLPFINSVHGIVKIRSKEFDDIWLTHCPIHPQEFDFRVAYNIHGHVHENSILTMRRQHQHQGLIYDPRYINICMEMQNYTPKTLEELLKR